MPTLAVQRSGRCGAELSVRRRDHAHVRHHAVRLDTRLENDCAGEPALADRVGHTHVGLVVFPSTGRFSASDRLLGRRLAIAGELAHQ
jgi:hypothetical protein